MNIVFNNYFPFKGFKSICLWPWMFVRNDVGRFDELPCLNHEMIHAAQQVELHIVGIVLTLFFLLTGYGWWSLLAAPLFFWWYGIEWAVRFAICRDRKAAYRGIVFEHEAYEHQYDTYYLDARQPFAWVNYYLKKTSENG